MNSRRPNSRCHILAYPPTRVKNPDLKVGRVYHSSKYVWYFSLIRANEERFRLCMPHTACWWLLWAARAPAAAAAKRADADSKSAQWAGEPASMKVQAAHTLGCAHHHRSRVQCTPSSKQAWAVAVGTAQGGRGLALAEIAAHCRRGCSAATGRKCRRAFLVQLVACVISLSTLH